MNKEKPFNEIWWVILILPAIVNDGLEIIFDLAALTGVGLAGEGIMEPLDAILDVFYEGVFVAKTGFGLPSFIELVACVLEAVFIPTRIISVVGCIYLANHPDSAASKTANVIGYAAGGELGAIEEVGEVGEIAVDGGEALEEGAEAAEATTAVAEEGGEAAGATEEIEEEVPEGEPEYQEETKPSQQRNNNNNNSGSSNNDKEEDEGDPLQSDEEKDPMQVEAERLNTLQGDDDDEDEYDQAA